MTTIEKYEVRNRWTGVSHTRKSTSRSKASVSARVVHTSAQKRRLDLFVTEPVYREMGWRNGGKVRPEFMIDGQSLKVRIFPSHDGLKACNQSPRSKTVRVPISGAPIDKGLCAKVRSVPFIIDGNTLIAHLPLEWALEYARLTGIELGDSHAAVTVGEKG